MRYLHHEEDLDEVLLESHTPAIIACTRAWDVCHRSQQFRIFLVESGLSGHAKCTRRVKRKNLHLFGFARASMRFVRGENQGARRGTRADSADFDSEEDSTAQLGMHAPTLEELDVRVILVNAELHPDLVLREKPKLPQVGYNGGWLDKKPSEKPEKVEVEADMEEAQETVEKWDSQETDAPIPSDNFLELVKHKNSVEREMLRSQLRFEVPSLSFFDGERMSSIGGPFSSAVAPGRVDDFFKELRSQRRARKELTSDEALSMERGNSESGRFEKHVSSPRDEDKAELLSRAESHGPFKLTAVAFSVNAVLEVHKRTRRFMGKLQSKFGSEPIPLKEGRSVVSSEIQATRNPARQLEISGSEDDSGSSRCSEVASS